MGLDINGTNIATSKEVFFNGTSMGAVYFNSSQVWRRSQTLTDTRVWCIDHFLYVNYDGNGNVKIAGAEPSGSVHTNRGDCGGSSQGWYTAVSFSTTGWTNVRIQVTGSTQGGGGGSYDTTIPVGNTLGNTNVTTYGDSGATQPTITVTVTLT